MKRIVIWVAVIFALIVAVLALVPLAVDLDKHRSAILARVQPAVNRKVDFTGIRLTLLGGIGVELRGVRLYDDPAFARDTFFSADKVRVKVALLPLLRKQVRVSTIILKDPVVHIIRLADGRANYQNILTPQPEKAKPGLAQTLLIKHVEIRNGRVSYADQKSRPEKEPLLIDAIHLKAREVSLFRPITFDLTAKVMHAQKENLSLNGTLGPLNLESSRSAMSIHARLLDIPLSVVFATFPAGTAGFTLDAEGNVGETITITTALDFNGIPLKTKTATSSGTLSGKVATTLLLNYPQETLRITNGTFTLGEDHGTFTGVIDKLRTLPSWNITLQSDGLHPLPLLTTLPKLAQHLPPTLTLQGPARFKVTTTGTPQAFQTASTVDLGTMGISYGTVFSKPAGVPLSLTASTTHQKGRIDIPSMTLGLDRLTASGQGRIELGKYAFDLKTDPLSLPTAARYIPPLASFTPTGSLQLTGKMDNATGKLALHVQAASNDLGLTLTKPQPSAAQGKMLSGPMRADLKDLRLTLEATKPPQGLQATGALHAGQGSLMQIPFRNLSGAYAYAADQLTIQNLAFDVFKGSIRTTAGYHLKHKQWSAAPQITNVQAGNILDAFATSKGVFAGTLSGTATARGAAGGAGMRALNADTSMRISQGEWRNFDLAGSTLGSLMAIPGFSQLTGIEPQTVQSYKTTRFDTLTTTLHIAQGIVTVENLQLTNIRTGKESDANALLKGTINLTTQALALQGNIALPKKTSLRLTQKAKGLQTLQDNTQRVSLPLRITGTLQKPSPFVDTRAVKEAMAGYLANKAVEKGLQKLREKTGVPVDEQTGKDVEQLIKGLFNR